MYGRRYRDRDLHFEASGGLIDSALVMQDRETDSYWSLMEGRALAGDYAGTVLQELPVGEKTRWRDWLRSHPDTLVLSVDGVEHVARDAYAGYWNDRRGFRGQKAKDGRLETKSPIYAFERAGVSYAAPHAILEGGHAARLEDGQWVLLYRRPGAKLSESTRAYVSGLGFHDQDGEWVDLATGARFEAERVRFVGGQVARLGGFDTFWYTWSLSHPDTTLLQ